MEHVQSPCRTYWHSGQVRVQSRCSDSLDQSLVMKGRLTSRFCSTSSPEMTAVSLTHPRVGWPCGCRLRVTWKSSTEGLQWPSLTVWASGRFRPNWVLSPNYVSRYGQVRQHRNLLVLIAFHLGIPPCILCTTLRPIVNWTVMECVHRHEVQML